MVATAASIPINTGFATPNVGAIAYSLERFPAYAANKIATSTNNP